MASVHQKPCTNQQRSSECSLVKRKPHTDRVDSQEEVVDQTVACLDRTFAFLLEINSTSPHFYGSQRLNARYCYKIVENGRWLKPRQQFVLPRISRRMPSHSRPLRWRPQQEKYSLYEVLSRFTFSCESLTRTHGLERLRTFWWMYYFGPHFRRVYPWHLLKGVEGRINTLPPGGKVQVSTVCRIPPCRGCPGRPVCKGIE